MLTTDQVQVSDWGPKPSDQEGESNEKLGEAFCYYFSFYDSSLNIFAFNELCPIGQLFRIQIERRATNQNLRIPMDLLST